MVKTIARLPAMLLTSFPPSSVLHPLRSVFSVPALLRLQFPSLERVLLTPSTCSESYQLVYEARVRVRMVMTSKLLRRVEMVLDPYLGLVLPFAI